MKLNACILDTKDFSTTVFTILSERRVIFKYSQITYEDCLKVSLLCIGQSIYVGTSSEPEGMYYFCLYKLSFHGFWDNRM
jgi:hypothetical protein